MRQPRRAELSGPGAQPLARLGVEGRLAKQTLGQRAHVESGSPNHDGLLSRGPHAGEPDARVPCELTRAIAFPRVDEINAQMGHARPLLLVGLRGADVEPPIDLPRVRGDGQDGCELAPRDGDRRFTDAGGAHEHGNEGAVSSAQTVAPARPSAAVRSWAGRARRADRKSTRLNSSHLVISYAVFCLKKKTPYSETGIYRRLKTSPTSTATCPLHATWCTLHTAPQIVCLLPLPPYSQHTSL